MVPTHSHRASHCKIKRLAGEDCGVAAICASERRGVECGPPSGKRGAGVMDGTGGWAGGVLPVPENASRQPGLDPATYATNLGMLAIQGFSDMKEQARDRMIRDRFIAGQEQCALRRQLDGFSHDTPIGEIVDSCRVWESHSDSNWIPRERYEPEVGSLKLGNEEKRKGL